MDSERLIVRVAIAAIVAIASPNAAADRPNVVLIFTDDQGVHDVGCYGSEIKTPHIDSLARDGLKFNQWYSASAICTPSRYGLLTSRNPSRSRDRLLSALMFLSEEDGQRGLQRSEPTVVQSLSNAGYRTALIGKWHLGHGAKRFLPTRHGFQTFFGHTGGCVDYFTMRYGNEPDWYRNEELIDVTGYATDVITDEAVHFLETADGESPFFLFLSYNAPHFGKGWNDGEVKTVNQLQPPPNDLARVAEISDITRRKYAATVVNLDDAVGRVLSTLEAEQLAHNTLVIFLTDHGGDPRYGGSNAPYRGDKATLFEGGIRVPCLMRWPARINPATESNAVLWSLDIGATLSRICDASLLAESDGLDFSSHLTGESLATSDRELYWELGQHNELERGRWVALRRGQWKYVKDNGGRQFLFNIARDPLEQHNLVASHGVLFEQLETRADRLRQIYSKNSD